MNPWVGIVTFEDLKMNARVEYQWPSFCSSMGGWNGGGLSDRAWPDHELIDTNIGTMFIVQERQNEEGQYVIEFEGYGLPQGSLAKEMELPE
jgi:hypothetical protein